MSFSNDNPFHKFFPDTWSVNLGLIPINTPVIPSIAPASAAASAVATTPTITATTRPASAAASAVATTPTLTVPIGVTVLDPEPVFYLPYDLVDGGKTTYSFHTDVFRSRWGLEWRTSCIDVPRKSLEFSVFLDPTVGDDREVFTNLVKHLPSSGIVGIIERSEEVTILEGTGTTVTVVSTQDLEWATPGKRVAVTGPQGTIYTYVVSATATEITLADDVSVYTVSAIIAPVTSCYLQSSQSFESAAVGEIIWQLQAVSVSLEPELGVFGGGSSAIIGISIPPTIISLGNVLYGYITAPVWDFPIVMAGNNISTVVDAGLEEEDAGSVVAFGPVRIYPDFVRQFKVRFKDAARRQWIKAFWGLVRGRACPFFMPTWTEDVLPFSDPSGTSFRVWDQLHTRIGSFSTWWDASQSHQFLQIVSVSGSVHYVRVTSYVPNGDGTITLTMASALTTVVSRVSLLELVRMESDDLVFQWSGGNYLVELTARTVEQ